MAGAAAIVRVVVDGDGQSFAKAEGAGGEGNEVGGRQAAAPWSILEIGGSTGR